jgi:hypothetical protein
MSFTKEATDYKAMYEGLYDDVARLLVDNRDWTGTPRSPRYLLCGWDQLRAKYDEAKDYR